MERGGRGAVNVGVFVEAETEYLIRLGLGDAVGWVSNLEGVSVDIEGEIFWRRTLHGRRFPWQSRDERLSK